MDFLPFARPTIDESMIAAVADTLRSRWLVTGPRVAAFEKALSERFDGRPVRTLTSATAAMQLALEVIGVKPGDEVILPAQSFFVTGNVIERAVILSPGPVLQVALGDLQKDEGSEMSYEGERESSSSHPAPRIPHPSKTLADAEREHILGALRESGWVVAGPKGAAARLGMKRSTLQDKMGKLGISRAPGC